MVVLYFFSLALPQLKSRDEDFICELSSINLTKVSPSHSIVSLAQNKKLIVIIYVQKRRDVIHLRERYSPIIGTTLNLLHPTSKVDWPIIPHYQPPPLSFLNRSKLSL